VVGWREGNGFNPFPRWTDVQESAMAAKKKAAKKKGKKK